MKAKGINLGLLASLLAGLLALKPTQLVACSSCGSGGADPVVLNPSEKTKTYLGLGLQTGFRDIDQRGEIRRNYGAEARQALTLALAQRIHPRAFVSLAAGIGRSRRGSESETGWLDTSLNLRANLVEQDFIDPWIPQVQVLLSHRFTTTRSIYDSKTESYLDAFGAGYDETYGGIDIWFGMLPVLFGGSFLYGYPQPLDTEAGSLSLAPLTRVIGTLGLLTTANSKVIGGIISEKRGGSENEGQPLPDSDRKSNDLFITFETLHPGTDTYRLSWSQKGSWGENKNASFSTVVTFAWMRPI